MFAGTENAARRSCEVNFLALVSRKVFACHAMQANEQVIRTLPRDQGVIPREFGHVAGGATSVPPRRASAAPLQRRPPLPVSCRLLERMGELQHAPIVPMTPDNLDAHGQSAVGEPAGH
jgi:hypothetical protein